MTSTISVRNLSKVFALAERGGRGASLLEALRSGRNHVNVREVRALQDVSFDIAHGERVGIIGANGAGKTTLLSVLAGLTNPSSGTVTLKGDVHAMLTIGEVLREDLTGRENIYLDASVHGRGRKDIDAAVEEVIAFTELGEFIERPVRTYSSGMKARLAFSMGAFIDADILIIDETLSVGDVFFGKKASARMREIAHRGSIVIMVTHGLRTIMEMCTRCLWFEGGRLMMDGDPKTVTEAYEKAVNDSDEADLKRKFGASTAPPGRTGAAAIREVIILQNGAPRSSTLAALDPVTIEIRGTIGSHTGDCDLALALLRVDGRRIWSRHASENGITLPGEGPFTIRVKLAPFMLGLDLYRLDVMLADGEGPCDTASRVFEVVGEPHTGGKPLLVYPPDIKVQPVEGPCP